MSSFEEVDVTTLFTTGKNDPRKIGKSAIAPMPVEKYSSEYNMNHRSRGKAIIFNHEYFNLEFLKPRHGTNLDRDRLIRSMKTLGFEVTAHNNFTTREVMETLESLSKEDHSDCDCICITVMSHGSMSFVFSKDSLYSYDSLWRNFTAENCPTLAGKPKIFLIQACKGSAFDDGFSIPYSSTETDACCSSYKIPGFADFLVAHSTIPGFVSWRDRDEGSWFIQSVCKELDDYGKQYDLLKLLTFVNQRVAICFETDTNLRQKQMPCISSMLTRLVKFSDKRIQ